MTIQTKCEQEPQVVRIGDMKISGDPEARIVTYALGSCIGIAAYDPAHKIGGILHFMLPEPTSAENGEKRPLAYGSIAIPALFRALYEAGAKKQDLVVKIAGGANMLKARGPFRIGEHNYVFAKNLLEKNGFTIAAADVGNIYGRTLRLRITDGYCSVTNPLHKEVLL